MDAEVWHRGSGGASGLAHLDSSRGAQAQAWLRPWAVQRPGCLRVPERPGRGRGCLGGTTGAETAASMGEGGEPLRLQPGRMS